METQIDRDRIATIRILKKWGFTNSQIIRFMGDTFWT